MSIDAASSNQVTCQMRHPPWTMQAQKNADLLDGT